MKVSLHEVKAGYSAIKKLAYSEFEKRNYEKSLDYVDKAVTIASQIMWRYADKDLDKLHSKIATCIIENQPNEFVPTKNRVVFYDYFGSTFILAIQYIKALSKLNYEILYIYEEQEWDLNVNVLDIINQIPNVKLKIIVNNTNKIERINEIYNTIVSFNPEKLFLHINTLSLCLPVLHSLPKKIVKYYINLGDHAFWLGSNAIDFSFEFRSFGAVVSNEKRSLQKNQLLLLPYYPIINGVKFLGFPENIDKKVIIFSGGDFYKMVDSKNTYWNLVKKVLSENESVIFLFANKILNQKGQVFLDNFIKSNGFENRFILIGFRPDINEVFKRSDIFMGTCPMSGGLMSQYASFNSKPILQYYPPELISFEETESMICYNNKKSISFTNEKDFLIEAKKLINNTEYRKSRGAELNACMITEQQFNNLFDKSLKSSTNQVRIDELNINYKKITNWWIEVNNEGFSDVGSYICAILGKKTYIFVPTLYLKSLLKKISAKILNIK